MPEAWEKVGQVEFAKDSESGVDMAFDALMNLEQNKDVSMFMRDFQETSEDVPDPKFSDNSTCTE